jgi:hypothetical protein
VVKESLVSMPNGTIGNDLDERSASPVANEALLSRPGPQHAITAPPQSDSEAVALLLGLYLAHELKGSMMSGRFQDLTIHTLREEGRNFDRVALNRLIQAAQKLYKQNVISSEQYSNAIVAAANMYAEQYASFRLESYLGKVSRYISKAFRRVQI